MSTSCPWLLLIHQIPPNPAYLRVKVWRRLQALGAVGVKNAVYVLPHSDGAHEDFQWLRREIEDGGGEAVVCEARFVEGLEDGQVRALFDAARDADYAALAKEARASREGDDLPVRRRRLRRRFEQVAAIDFFGAPGREAADGLIRALEAAPAPEKETAIRADLVGRVWVTRENIGIDRMASAWLIRRFIDPKARFRFVPAKHRRFAPRELRFDMFEAEFTHEGDLCTFEVLLCQTALRDAGLIRIAEIVHDADLKDGKFGHEETAGIVAAVAAIAAGHPRDEDRLVQAAALFENLHTLWRNS